MTPRRTVLRATGIAAAATAATAWTARGRDSGTPGTSGTPTAVLVHTTHASAAWFTALAAELALSGGRALAVDLPGHGPGAFFPVSYQAPQDPAELATEPSPAAALALRDYVDHVTRAVRAARRYGPVILVAHGDGGATMNLVANAVPHLLDHLVYLAAGCCVELPALGDYFQAPENVDAVPVPVVGDPAELGVTRINWRTADPDALRAYQDALAGTHTETEFLAMLNSLQPDEPAAVWGTEARGNPDTWGRIPRTYVRFGADRTVTPKLQDRMIAEADARTPDNRFTVHTVPAPHAGPLHRPEIVDVLGRLILR